MRETKLKIAQISSIWENTPPDLYGGTERVAYNLTEELVKMGHEVTLFATGESKTSAKLQFTSPKALYRNNIPWSVGSYQILHLDNAFSQAENFDIIHMHFNTRHDYISLALSGYVKTPTLFTVHFLLPKEGDRLTVMRHYKDKNFATISHAQKTLPFLNYAGTVYNGLDFKNVKFIEKPKNYLVWMGRICHDKGTFEAIQVAKSLNIPLIIAGKADLVNRVYFEKKIKPYFDGKTVNYVGELNDSQKNEIVGNAIALLNPLNWNEPFGLVTIEAMSYGTPVIAFDRGPIREQMINGKTGFIVNNIYEMAEAVKKIHTIDRQFCHQHALSNFNSFKMATGYEKIYEKILDKIPKNSLTL